MGLISSWISPDWGLGGLFLISFLSATLLPGGSELAFLGFIYAFPQQAMGAWSLACAGNTLGGVSTYLCGRLLPPYRDDSKSSERLIQLERVRRWGPGILLLSWVPVVGDGFCLAAGWLRLPWLFCVLAMAVGKGARYGVLWWGIAG